MIFKKILFQADAVRKIALYVEKNPRASTSEQAREIQKHVDDFAAKVALVNGAQFMF